MDQLKSVIQDLINDRKEQALATIHQYFVHKVQGMNESSNVKQLKLKINSDMTDDQIWAWVEQQEIMTIEDFDKKGDTLYITPAWGHKDTNSDSEHMDFQKELQRNLNNFDPEDQDEDDGEGFDDEDDIKTGSSPFGKPRHTNDDEHGKHVSPNSKLINPSSPPGNKTSHIG